MKVELYLRNINQEMIDTPHAKGSAGWNVSWPKSCCIIDVRAFGSEASKAARPSFALRHEKEGGMFWDPITTSVYKVDEEAYLAMLALDHGMREDEVARSLKVPLDSVESLVKTLRELKTPR